MDRLHTLLHVLGVVRPNDCVESSQDIPQPHIAYFQKFELDVKKVANILLDIESRSTCPAS